MAAIITKSLNVTPKTTEQHLIVRRSKSEAEVTIIKDCARGITLLKLTTDGHKASCGLSVIAELHVNVSTPQSLFNKTVKLTHSKLLALPELAYLSTTEVCSVQMNAYLYKSLKHNAVTQQFYYRSRGCTV